MSQARHKVILNKSVQASVAAIEVYNKPDFKYREETFSILMINAWELLFKARILQLNNGKFNSIYVPARTVTAEGKKLKRFYPKRNRSGNPMTLDVFSAMNKLDIPAPLKENMTLLVEIRDNAIHHINEFKSFEKVVLEVGTATLKSYLTLAQEWFNYDLENYNFFLMPVSFFHPYEMESFSTNSKNRQMENFLAYVSQKLIDNPTELQSSHNIALRLETRLERSMSAEALPVRYSKDSPIVVRQTIENKIRDGLANGSLFEYRDFVEKCREKISGFKQNKIFTDKCKELKTDEKYCITQYLNPVKKSGGKKDYWTSEAFKKMCELYATK